MAGGVACYNLTVNLTEHKGNSRAFIFLDRFPRDGKKILLVPCLGAPQRLLAAWQMKELIVMGNGKYVAVWGEALRILLGELLCGFFMTVACRDGVLMLISYRRLFLPKVLVPWAIPSRL